MSHDCRHHDTGCAEKALREPIGDRNGLRAALRMSEKSEGA